MRMKLRVTPLSGLYSIFSRIFLVARVTYRCFPAGDFVRLPVDCVFRPSGAFSVKLERSQVILFLYVQPKAAAHRGVTERAIAETKSVYTRQAGCDRNKLMRPLGSSSRPTFL